MTLSLANRSIIVASLVLTAMLSTLRASDEGYCLTVEVWHPVSEGHQIVTGLDGNVEYTRVVNGMAQAVFSRHISDPVPLVSIETRDGWSVLTLDQGQNDCIWDCVEYDDKKIDLDTGKCESPHLNAKCEECVVSCPAPEDWLNKVEQGIRDGIRRIQSLFD